MLDTIEYISLADENGFPVASCERHADRPAGCFTQIAAVFILNSKGNLILQKRSAFKSKDALKWCYSAGGHVNAGETYEQAALRELEEEMGIQGTLVSYIGQTRAYVNNNPKSFVKAFLVYHDGPFKFDPQEVHEIKEFTLPELSKLVCTQKELFKQTFIDIFYQFINPFGRDINSFILKYNSELSDKKTALDIGCAYGANSLHLAQKGVRVTAVDKTLPIDKAPHALINFIQADICDFPLESYDIIMAFSVLQFINKYDQKALLNKLIKGLNPKGFLFITAFTQADPTYQKSFKITGHFASHELQDFISKAGLTILEEQEEIITDTHPPIGEHKHGLVRVIAQKK